MNSQVCVDASVALKLVLDESDSDQAEALWSHWKNNELVIIAPYHFVYEATSVIRNRVYRNILLPEEGQTAFEILQAYDIRFLHPLGIIERAWFFAQRFNRPTVYDFWTADRRLYSVVNQTLPWVKWLGDFHL
jgi:predicted nucleic acid-binding protein